MKKHKNYRLSDATLAKMDSCMHELGLMNEVTVIRVAVELLYRERESLNITPLLVAMRRTEESDE